MRTPFIAGNWKMNLDRARARVMVEGCVTSRGGLPDCEIGLFPPFTMLAEVAAAARGRDLWIGAQNCHAEAAGAYTGEVSAAMIADAGATHVILGHSERRRDFGEDEPLLAKKLAAALHHSLTPILCVGETLAQRDAGLTEAVVIAQVGGALGSFAAADLTGLIVAYEPVWAIGTGRNATPAQAVEVHRAIRGCVQERFGDSFATGLRILYGGSVKADNAGSLLGEPEIDGALVGGASLDLDSFLAIARSAS